MYCLRCGKDTQSEAVFCDGCLENMGRHPIRPGTPIQLPHRPDPVRRNKSRQGPTMEEQLFGLKKLIFAMGLLLVILTAALGVAAFFLLTGAGF